MRKWEHTGHRCGMTEGCPAAWPNQWITVYFEGGRSARGFI